jgi:hypothetical protein
MKNKSKIILAACAGLIGGSLLTSAMFVWRGPETLHAKASSQLPLENAALMAADYLQRSVNQDGSFVYSYDPVKNKVAKTYNILRHAGTIYSMLEYYDFQRDPALLKKIDVAIDYLLKTTQSCPGTVHELCVVESGYTKVGGNALALLALSRRMAITGETKHLEEMRGLAKRLSTVQKPSGEFGLHKQDVKTGEDKNTISEYYPGEAIYGLLSFYEVDKNPLWLQTAKRATEWLITVRDKELTINNIEHDHWLLYGLDKLYKHAPEEMFLVHARKIVDAILISQIVSPTIPAWVGGFYIPPGSTPTAARSEGLLAAYRLFSRLEGKEDYAPYPQKILASAKLAVRYQLSTQVTNERLALLGLHQQASGGFTSSLTNFEIRNDYVQHNLSSILALRRAMAEHETVADSFLKKLKNEITF